MGGNCKETAGAEAIDDAHYGHHTLSALPVRNWGDFSSVDPGSQAFGPPCSLESPSVMDTAPIENVGGSIGVALSSGALLVIAVQPIAEAHNALWCCKHVSVVKRRKIAATVVSSDTTPQVDCDTAMQEEMGFEYLAWNHPDPEWQQVYLVRQVMDAEDAAHIMAIAEDHASSISGWTSKRHHRHSTIDLPVSLLTPVREMVFDFVRKTILPALATCYMVSIEQLSLKDLFIVKYQAFSNDEPQVRGLESHVDGCAFSFNVLLSNPTDFDGGGTQFDVLDRNTAVKTLQGDCLIHPGSLRHAGLPITRGRRYLLVGFVDRSKNACHYKGQMSKLETIQSS